LTFSTVSKAISTTVLGIINLTQSICHTISHNLIFIRKIASVGQYG